MADIRITSLTAIAAAVDPATDVIPMVDVSDTTQHATGSTKKATPTQVVSVVKLDDLAAPDDVTTLNASTSAHGLLLKLSGTATTYLNGSGAWSTPPDTGGGGGGDVVGPSSATDNAAARFDGTTGTLIQNSVVLIGDTGAVTGVTTLAASGAVTVGSVVTAGLVDGVDVSTLSTVVQATSTFTADDRLLRADGAGGRLAQASGVTLLDGGGMSGVGALTMSGDLTLSSGDIIVSGLVDGIDVATDAATQASHIAATVVHGATGAVVGTTNTQTLTNKTLTTPTIASFTNATHDHTSAATGGSIAAIREALFFARGRILEFQEQTQPGAPAVGDAYVTATTVLTGATWVGDRVVEWTGAAWDQYAFAEGMRLHVAMAAAHHFEGAGITYSSTESLWYPVSDLWVTTEHWTGRYFIGTTEKIFCKSFTGNLAASPATTTVITHGVTLDFTFPPCAWGCVLAASNTGIVIPQDFGTLFTLQVGSSAITIGHSSLALTRKYNIRFEYAK